jgi:hypothetical protein
MGSLTNAYSAASDLLSHLKLISCVIFPQSVMQYMLAHIVGIGRSADEYDRQVLSISAAYTIEG